MALVPIVAVVTASVAGLMVWGEVESLNQRKSENTAKEWKTFESRLDHAFNKYKRHETKGEFAQAINGLKEYIDLNRQRGSVPPQDERMLGRMLENLTFKGQAKGQGLSREFKSTEARLKDDAYARAHAHYDYIEKLKVALPEEDAFLRKEVERYDRLNPQISLYD